MSETKLLTERELAEALRCSVAAIRAWRSEGLPARKLGRLVRFELSTVLAWFERRQQESEQEKVTGVVR